MNDQNLQREANFFLPLNGHENISRLEEKFAHFYDSDYEESDSVRCKEAKPNNGKVSQWKPSPDPQGKWLHSPSKSGPKSTRKCVVASGGEVKYKSPRPVRQKNRAQYKRKSPASTRQLQQDNSAGASTSKQSRNSAQEYAPCVDALAVKQSPKTPEVGTTSRCYESGHLDDKILDVWNEFSEADAEKPNLHVEPVAAKVDFLLSVEDEVPRVAVPACINQYLRDYQRDGIRFLYEHYSKGTGAILGDDMGLGKTVQVIGFLAALLGKTGKQIDTFQAIPKFIKQISNDFPNTPPKKATRPFLIIGPTAVLFNWLDELNTWGYFITRKYHGPDKETCLSDVKKGKLEVVVTTFETFRDNVAQLNEFEWEAVIVDEVHKIKGLKAQVTQALRIIKTPCRFGLTGTALQNNMTELYSLLDWAQPKVLGSLEQFETEYVRAIEQGQKHDATKRELALARKQRDRFGYIRKKMLLRRTKALIASQLPNKEELVVMCRLSDLQLNVYRTILDHPDMRLVLQAEDPCDCGKEKQRASCCYKCRADGTKIWSLVFSFMHLMLKAANHVGLLIPDGDATADMSRLSDSDNEDNAVKEKPGPALARSVFRLAFRDQPQFVELTRSAAFRTLSDPRYCGKMKILQGLLQVFEKNHDKVLIFSYSTKLLDIIEHYIISQGHEYSRIDGKISGMKRQEVVHKFNADPSIFICLISTKAGGLGLNLTGANRVVIFDPNWNPSHDLQAQDRAYRIGQTRDVKVFRLVTAGTIEENIYLRQIYKQQLDEVAVSSINARRYFHGIQGDKTNRGELFGIKNMFSLRTGGVCLTSDILKRNEKLEQGLAGFDITKYVPPANDSKTTDASPESEDDISVDEPTSEFDDSAFVRAEEEEKEEDEHFLQDLFGIDRIKVQLPSTKSRAEKISTDKTKEMRRNGSNSSSSDEEFSLIPTLHRNKKKAPDQNRQGERSDMITDKDNNAADSKLTSCSVSVDSLNFETEKSQHVSHNFDDLFSMTDITFSSKRIYDTSMLTCKSKDGKSEMYDEDLQTNSGNTVIKQRSGYTSGISWLFSDSESMGNNYNDHDDDGQETNHGKDVRHIKTLDIAKRMIDEESYAKEKSVSPKKRVRICNSEKKDDREDDDHKPKTLTSKKKKTTFSSEQSLLAASDILSTHTNAAVLGASRAEDHMTRCAIKDVYELHTNTQNPALACDPLSQPKEEEMNVKPSKRKTRKTSGEEKNYNKQQCITSGCYKLLVGQTPPAIARKQWSELAAKHKLSELDLARYILKSSVEERLNTLKGFYRQKHPSAVLEEPLEKLYSLVDNSEGGGEQTHNSKITSSERRRKTSVNNDKPSVPKTAQISPSRRRRKRLAGISPVKTKPSKEPPPFLLDISTLASDSQESLTARSPPPHLNMSDDEDHDDGAGPSCSGYEPVSPIAPRKKLSPCKISPSSLRSQHRTKLRHKSGGVNDIQSCKSTKREIEKDDCSVKILSGAGPSCVSVSYKQTSAANEDIPSLLCEMAQPSIDSEWIKPSSSAYKSVSKVGKSFSEGESDLQHSKKDIVGSAAHGRLDDAQCVGRSEETSGVRSRPGRLTKKVTPSKCRRPVSILDDIFGGEADPSLSCDNQKTSKPSFNSDSDEHGKLKEREQWKEKQVMKMNTRYIVLTSQHNESLKSLNNNDITHLPDVCHNKKSNLVTSVVHESLKSNVRTSSDNKSDPHCSRHSVLPPQSKTKTSESQRGLTHNNSSASTAVANKSTTTTNNKNNDTNAITYSKNSPIATASRCDLDVFDPRLTSSTLKEDSPLKRSTTKKDRAVYHKGGGGTSRQLFANDRPDVKDNDDFDNLDNWAKYHGKANAPARRGSSESLFT